MHNSMKSSLTQDVHFILSQQYFPLPYATDSILFAQLSYSYVYCKRQ